MRPPPLMSLYLGIPLQRPSKTTPKPVQCFSIGTQTVTPSDIPDVNVATPKNLDVQTSTPSVEQTSTPIAIVEQNVTHTDSEDTIHTPTDSDIPFTDLTTGPFSSSYYETLFPFFRI